jgi:hypothetical protein
MSKQIQSSNVKFWTLDFVIDLTFGVRILKLKDSKLYAIFLVYETQFKQE